MGGDGGLGPDLGELGVVSQNQSAQDHVLDDGVEKEVEGTNTRRQAEEDQQNWKKIIKGVDMSIIFIFEIAIIGRNCVSECLF